MPIMSFVIPGGQWQLSTLPAERVNNGLVALLPRCYNVSLGLEAIYGRGTAQSEGTCPSGAV